MRAYLAGAAVIMAAAMTSPVAAQSFNYPNFNNTSNLQINGNAAVATDGSNRQVLRVTPSTGGQAGSAFSQTLINLSSNASFSTSFTFNINGSGGGGADGLVFVIQSNSNSVGSSGGGIGYQFIPNSLGIEFDTWDNNEPFGDNHVGINLDGDINSETSIGSPFGLDSGIDLTAFIDYNGATGQLEVRLSDNGLRPGAALLTYGGLNLATVLGQTSAYVGFTSGTGSSFSNHDIVNWRFENSFAPIGAVPEPGTWAMMILGFGLAGGVLRRRRVRVTYA